MPARGPGGIVGTAGTNAAVTANGAASSTPPHKGVVAAGGGGGGGHGKKVMSEPLSRTVTSVRAFSGELSRLGLLITFAYMCEHHPPFAHGAKVGVYWVPSYFLFFLWGFAGGSAFADAGTAVWRFVRYLSLIRRMTDCF